MRVNGRAARENERTAAVQAGLFYTLALNHMTKKPICASGANGIAPFSRISTVRPINIRSDLELSFPIANLTTELVASVSGHTVRIIKPSRSQRAILTDTG
jgi:hypothetical protein